MVKSIYPQIGSNVMLLPLLKCELPCTTFTSFSYFHARLLKIPLHFEPNVKCTIFHCILWVQTSTQTDNPNEGRVSDTRWDAVAKDGKAGWDVLQLGGV